MNILVLGTGNSARSIMLESILDDRGGNRITAFSAGARPAGQVHPQSYKLLEELGYDTADARSKSWDEFLGPKAPEMDLIITVCAHAAPRPPAGWPGTPVLGLWPIADPTAVPEDDWETAFRTAHDILDRRATALLKHPIENMDSGELKATLTRIAKK